MNISTVLMNSAAIWLYWCSILKTVKLQQCFKDESPHSLHSNAQSHFHIKNSHQRTNDDIPATSKRESMSATKSTYKRKVGKTVNAGAIVNASPPRTELNANAEGKDRNKLLPWKSSEPSASHTIFQIPLEIKKSEPWQQILSAIKSTATPKLRNRKKFDDYFESLRQSLMRKSGKSNLKAAATESLANTNSIIGGVWQKPKTATSPPIAKNVMYKSSCHPDPKDHDSTGGGKFKGKSTCSSTPTVKPGTKKRDCNCVCKRTCPEDNGKVAEGVLSVVDKGMCLMQQFAQGFKGAFDFMAAFLKNSNCNQADAVIYDKQTTQNSQPSTEYFNEYGNNRIIRSDLDHCNYCCN